MVRVQVQVLVQVRVLVQPECWEWQHPSVALHLISISSSSNTHYKIRYLFRTHLLPSRHCQQCLCVVLRFDNTITTVLATDFAR